MLGATTLAACAPTVAVTSAWSPRPIVVDGRGDDWAGVDSQGVADDALYVAVTNDSSHVYLLLTTPRADVARTLRARGLTLWLDGAGGKAKDRALRIIGRGGPPGFAADESERKPDEGARAPEPSPGDDAARAVGEPHTLALEYVTADGHGDRRVVGGDCGAAASMSRVEDTWSYEIAIPLASSACPPIALHADPGQAIGVGLELALPEPGRARSPDRGRGEGPRGGGGAPGGGGRFGGGRAGGGRFGGGGESHAGAQGSRHERTAAKPTEVWLQVKLAATPASPPRAP